MIHWAWMIVAFYGGVVATWVFLSLLMAAKDEKKISMPPEVK